MENGKDKGQSIREKIGLIVDLLNSDQQLMQERTEAYEYRKKFYPGTGPTPSQAGLESQSSYGGGGSSGGVPSYGGSSSKGTYSGSGGLGQSSQNKVYSPYGENTSNDN